MTPMMTHAAALSRSLSTPHLSTPMKKGVLACFVLLACLACRADVGSSAYVQAQLVAHWDGIDNTVTNGVRFHDPAATNWCDLSGQANNVWLPTFVSVESNALYSSVVAGKSTAAEINSSKTGLCPTLAKLTGLNHWTNDPAFTVEIVMQRVQWRYTDNYYNLQNVFSTPRGTAGYRFNETNGFYFFGPTSKANLSLMNWSAGVRADAMHTVSTVLGNSLSTDILRMDGVQNTIDMNGGYNTPWSTNFTFFGNLRADIRVHAIRVYSRILTQYELDRNALLDRIRFLGDTDVPFLVKPMPDQSFDGVNACTPDPVVVDPATEQKLVKGTDYALSYAANDRAGYATVTVTGLNAWSGHEVTVPFLICSSDAYRVVEYIQSTGTQYIDTEYYPNPNTRMEAEFLFVGDKGNRSVPVGYSPFGCAESNGLASFSMNFGASEVQDNQLYTWFEKTYGQGAPVKNMTINSRTVRSTFTVNAGTGAAQYGTVTLQAVPKTTTHSVNAMCIFGAGGADGLVTPFTVFGMRVFGWKIWDNNTLVRDFVPCYRVFDLSVGLLDRVSGRFFTNAGTGAFSYDIATYDAALPAAYRQLDALVATGAQHIATGVYANSNTAVTVEFTPYDVTAQRRVFAARATAPSAATADDLFFEAYVNGSGRWACCCTDGPYDSASDSAGLWSSGSTAPSAGTKTSFTLDSHGDAFYVNGAKQVSLARSRTQNSPVPIELMRAGGTADEYGWGKLYAAYIWQNGLILRNFVPCYRVADGLTGLYDLVTGTFFPSEGDSPFLRGTGGEVGIPHFTGVYGQSRLSANTCFWNLTNFSFTVWTKNPDVGRYGWETERYGTLFSQGALGNQPGFACYMSHNTTNGSYALTVQTRNTQNQTVYLRTGAETLRTDGRWHHVAYTYDLGAGVARLYLDGKVMDANTDPAKMVDPSLTWYIPVTLGGRSGEYSMMGELAYATLWNRAITESEVDFTRRHPVSGTEAGLIGCWSLDGGDAGLLDGVANGAAEHDLTAVAEVGFVADEVKWHVAGLMILVR